MASHEEHEPESSPEQSAPASRFARLPRPLRAPLEWLFKGRVRAAVVLGACLASVAGAIVGWTLLGKAPPVEKKVTLAMCLEAVDNGSYARAAALAKKLEANGDSSLAKKSGLAYIAGVSAASEAGRIKGQTSLEQKSRAEEYTCAARYLEESRELGFPEGHEAEGCYWLGKSLYLGGRISAARDAMEEAISLDCREKSEMHRLLAEAWLRGENADLSRAAAQNEAYLSDDNLSPESRNAAIAQWASALIGQGRIDEGAAALAKLPPEAKRAAPAMVVQARILMHEAKTLATKGDETAAKEKTRRAIALLRKAAQTDAGDTGAAEAAMYLIGVCFLEANDPRAALAQFQRTRRIHGDREEGAAASLQEADLLRRENDWAGALAAYERGLESAAAPDEYANPWIPLNELRTRAKSLLQAMFDKKEFGECIEAAKVFRPVFGKSRALELTAQTHEAWSKDLFGRAEGLPPAKADSLQREARAHLRQAGDIRAELAELDRMTRQYCDRLWSAASSHFQGRDYRKAIAELDTYLQNESQRRRAGALVMQGEAMLALNRLDDAIAALTECIDYHPKDVASFRARLLLAQAWAEKGEPLRAEAFLVENLTGDLLTPAGKEWRDSLFQLGDLLHAEGRHADAIARLDEALNRYPDAPQAFSARYLLAHSRLVMASAAKDELERDLSAEQRAARQQQFTENLAAAEKLYREIREISLRRESRESLRPHEAAIARNAVFALGEILTDQGDFPAAIKMYYAAANRSLDRPEALSAYLEIARLYRRLGKAIESKTTIEQAKVLLASLKADANIEETTNYNRTQWAELLDGLGSL